MNNQSITLQATLIQRLNRMPNPSRSLADRRLTIDLFKKVESQPDVFSAIQNYRDSLCAMNVSVQDERLSRYLQQIDLRSFIRGCLAARDYGYAVMEVTRYEQLDGLAVPTLIERCDPERFGFDSERRLRLYSQRAPQGEILEEVYPEKFILVQHEHTLSNPYGVGLLDIGYWIAVGLSGNYEFMMTFAEEDGRDKWIGVYPPNASEKDKAELMDSLIKIRNGGAAIYPEGMNVTPKDLSSRSASGALYKAIDEMLRRKVSQLWFGTDLLMQVDGKGGYSSSQSGIQIKEDALGAGKYLIKLGLDQLFRIIRQINGLPAAQTAIQIERPRQLDKQAAEIDKIYHDMGMKPTATLLQKRGYKAEDFTLSEAPTPAPSGAFAQADERELAELFEMFSKKKSLTDSTDEIIQALAQVLYEATQKSYLRGRLSVWRTMPREASAGRAVHFADAFDALIAEGSMSAAEWLRFQSFTSALIADERVRKAIGELLHKSLATGQGAMPFQRAAREVLHKAGLSKVSPHQLRTIYDTNTAVAFAMGQVAQMQEAKDLFPSWQYIALDDSRARESHRALHGRIFSVDDTSYYPPIGFNCRCTARPLTQNQAARLQGNAPASSPESPQNIEGGELIGDKRKTYMRWFDGRLKELPQESLVRMMERAEEDDMLYVSFIKSEHLKAFAKRLQRLLKRRE